jgi:hypothetical protein
MKKLLPLIVLFGVMPLLIQSEASGFSVQTNGGDIEVKTGNPPPPPNPQVIVVRPAAPQVVERTTVVQPVERTTVVQPSGSSGCGLLQN